jgi:DNA-binding response OmpR family regulator
MIALRDSVMTVQKILIIDDDSDYRKLLLKWLASEFHGVEVIEFDPQSQGTPGADFDWSLFDILILDYELNLNNATGLDVLKTINRNGLFPAIIMLTGAGSEDIAVRAFKAGVTDYLRKEWLDRHKLKIAVDNAFTHLSSNRQYLNSMDEVRKEAHIKSEKVIAEFKSKYAKLHELELKRIKQEREKIKKDLQKQQELLQQIEQERQKAEQARQNLIAEMEKLNAKQAVVSEDTGLIKKLETTQQKLEQTDAGIDRIEQDYKQTKAAVVKTIWKQDQEVELQQQLEKDMASFKEEMSQQEKQMSEFNSRMKEQINLLSSLASGNKENTKKHDKSLLDDISSMLGKEDK